MRFQKQAEVPILRRTKREAQKVYGHFGLVPVKEKGKGGSIPQHRTDFVIWSAKDLRPAGKN